MVAFAKQFDPTGNWTNFKQDTDGDNDWDLDQNRTHNEANEIATVAGASTHVAHDRAGNIIRAPKPSNWADHYHLEYDAWNRLVTVFDADGETLVAGYNYDALGRRVEKETYSGGSLTEIRHFYYSNQWQVLEEHVQANYCSGSSSSSLQPPAPSLQYVWGLRYVDDLILRDRDADSDSETGNLGKTGSGLEERLYAMQDANWNVVAISGSILERYCYDAYGKPTFLTSTFGSRASTDYDWETLFTGRQHDPETGLYDYRNRIYHAPLGRFLTQAPIGYEGGDANLNFYYSNKPTNAADPNGTCEAETFPEATGMFFGGVDRLFPRIRIRRGHFECDFKAGYPWIWVLHTRTWPATGCIYLHEIMHFVDIAPCCLRALWEYYHTSDEAGKKRIEDEYHKWEAANHDFAECRAHRVSMKCSKFFYSLLGCQRCLKDNDPPPGSIEQRCVDLKLIIDISQGGIDKYCPKAEAKGWKWEKCPDFKKIAQRR